MLGIESPEFAVFSNMFVRPALLVLTSVFFKKKKVCVSVIFCSKEPWLRRLFSNTFVRPTIFVITSVFKKESKNVEGYMSFRSARSLI